ncbi:MAG TPA: prenyltransferase/squalene oxidase repeat-containing protein, partial [Solirubrobacteraceae bacterium]|nr:prenyltransferase/squalene oxidase repeat-containing protein [Solirubrobacteraceae bacterium]
MSWQAGAFSILALALAGGFAWYERARPDARIVALVATLAAFAALGRIAFAALPNVKPTSDIVLVSGFALGAGPGFVVGALAGLVSNFFFGQGPWTPWQMAAWGATGMLGAWVALITARRIGRWPLALVCAAAGFAFTAIQDVGDWVTYSDHSLAQLGVYVGKGLGFDAVYAVSCLVFALAFGPALARAITRFATRLQVTWQPAASAVVALVAVAGLLGGQARAGSSPTSYLLSAQNADGGYGPAPRQGSDGLYSGWAALGLAAEGVNPQTVTRDGHSLAGYIEAGGGGGSDPGSLERTILALRASGLPATTEVARLKRDIGVNGSVSSQTNLTSFAVLALRAAAVPLPADTLGWLTRQQDPDGGFNYATAGGVSDVDDTGAALEALGAPRGRVTARAVRFIESQQNRDGGFPSQAGSDSNAQSTAWAVQGLLAVGAGGKALTRALAYLSALIAPDGHVRYSRGVDQTPV